jgi:soluble lytic murein transglycosylase-like protein
MLYICCLVSVLVLAASPISAAEPSPAPGEKFVVRADPRTGKLVRTVAVSAPRPPKREITEMVDKTARKHDVDPLLVHSVIQVESDYDPHAVSPKGAQGLMQLMPSTARMMGVADSFDPEQNIEGGVRYLKYLQGVYKDDRLALAAYNAGPAAVDKYKNVPPYAETQKYVSEVGKRYQHARNAAVAAAPGAEPAPVVTQVVAPPVEQHPKVETFIDGTGRLYLRTQ